MLRREAQVVEQVVRESEPRQRVHKSVSAAQRLSWGFRPLVAVVIVAVVLGLRLVGDGIGLSSFVVAGTLFVDGAETPAELIIKDSGTGYDGQFFYRLSLDPLTKVRTEFGITLDEPGYRQQRIGLPMAAYALRQLTGVSTLVWLPVLNLLGVALLTGAAERLLIRAGANRWWAVAVGVSPGVLIAARLDLPEPLALGLALAGVAAWRRSPFAASLLLAAAVLTRETTLALAGGVGIAATVLWWQAYRRDGRIPREESVRTLLAVLPLVVVVAWQLWLRNNWGAGVPSSSAERLGTPGMGLFRSLTGVFLPFDVPEWQQWGWWLLRVGLVLVVVAGLLAIRKSSMPAEVKWGLALSSVVVLAVGSLTTSQQSTRTTVEAVTLSLLVLAATPVRIAQLKAMAVPVLAFLAIALTP